MRRAALQEETLWTNCVKEVECHPCRDLRRGMASTETLGFTQAVSSSHHRKYMAIKRPKTFTFYVYLVMKNIPLSPTGLKVTKQKGLGPCSSIWCFLWHQQLQQRVQAETSTDSCCIAINTRTHIPTHSSWFHVNHCYPTPKTGIQDATGTNTVDFTTWGILGLNCQAFCDSLGPLYSEIPEWKK